MTPLSLLIPHHFIIVSGRSTRLVDTQSGKRGAMMNCSLLVLSMMIIINFPPALAGEWGPESSAVAAPPPWAVTEPAIITYHRQSLGPRLNADGNEKHSFSNVLVFVYGCVYQRAQCFNLRPFFSLPVLSSFSSWILPHFFVNASLCTNTKAEIFIKTFSSLYIYIYKVWLFAYVTGLWQPNVLRGNRSMTWWDFSIKTMKK